MLALLVLAALVLLIWSLAAGPFSKPLPKPTPEQERARRLGTLTGLMGGDIEDALVARHGLDRSGTPPSERDLRDEATAVSMRIGSDPD